MITDAATPNVNKTVEEESPLCEDESTMVHQKRRRSDPLTREDQQADLQPLISTLIEHALKTNGTAPTAH